MNTRKKDDQHTSILSQTTWLELPCEVDFYSKQNVQHESLLSEQCFLLQEMSHKCLGFVRDYF